MKPPEGASAGASEFRQNIQEKIEEKALEENKIQSDSFDLEESKELKQLEKLQDSEITIYNWFKGLKLPMSILTFQKEIKTLIENNKEFLDIKLFERQVIGKKSLTLTKADKEKIENSEIFKDWLSKKKETEKLQMDEITIHNWFKELKLPMSILTFQKEIRALIENNKDLSDIKLFERRVAGIKKSLTLTKADKEKIENSEVFKKWLAQKKETMLRDDEITVRSWFKDLKSFIDAKTFQKEIRTLIENNKEFVDIKLFERRVAGTKKSLTLTKADKEKIEKNPIFQAWLKNKQEKKEELKQFEKLQKNEIAFSKWWKSLEIPGDFRSFITFIKINFPEIETFERLVSNNKSLVLKEVDKERIEKDDIFIEWLDQKNVEKEKFEKLQKNEITFSKWWKSLGIPGDSPSFITFIKINFPEIETFERRVKSTKALALKEVDKERIEKDDIFIEWLAQKNVKKEELEQFEKLQENEITFSKWWKSLKRPGIISFFIAFIKNTFSEIETFERRVAGIKKSLTLTKADKEKIENSEIFKDWLSKKKETEKLQMDEITIHNWFKELKLPMSILTFQKEIRALIENNKDLSDIKLFERRVAGIKKSLTLTKADKEKIENSEVFKKWLAQKKVKNKEKEKQELENQKSEQLENFCKDKEQNREPIKELLDAMQIFGASKCVDILYKFHPEFRDLPQEKVKKVIGDYLGDFMMSRGSLDYVFHDGAAEFLSDLDFRGAAKEFFKDNCYRKLIKLKKTGYIREDALLDIIREYEISFDNIQTNKDILREIIAEVKKYYQDIFNFAKPERFVDEIKEGVSFPNLNQKINVKELEEKKSLLIADKMGTGKSASVLMAKEYLGINKCLLLAPSNVLETWKGYLSDNPNQKGCYKTGQAPKTLFLENPKDLEKLNDDQWEYVVISLEKMKESYLDPLKKIGFDMIVVDEIHKLKNPKGFRAQKLFDFIGEKENQDQYFCALSGTPAPNKVKDFAVSIKSLYADNKKIANMDIKDLTYNIIKGHQIDLRSLLIPRMQMKEMSESLEMPEKQEIKEDIKMDEEEKIIYNSILDDDELTASEKIITLRKFLLNPNIFIKAGSKFEGSKIKKTRSLLREKFLVENESRVILYVNDYIDGVIREDGAGNNIVDKLGLPSDIKILCVHGENKEERLKIQEEFNNRESKGKEKILLLVSGQTADVGVDYTGADSLIVYNEPWSEYDLQQQIARVHRPGVDHDLKVHRLVVKDSIEEGIHEYIKLKQIAIEKVLQGIPRKELEEQILIEDEKENNLIEINNALADKYLSRQDRQTKRFGYCAELGENKFVGKVVSTEHGPEYAENYHEMGRRSYQANLNRVSGTVLKELCRLNKQKPQDVKIADFGSGPEMLRQYISDDLRDNIYSLDINPSHFDYCDPKDENKKWFVGSIKKSPFKDGEFDYLNFSAAFHYTESLNYKENTLERLETIMEMNRVLKEGGIALLNMVYVYRFRNMDDFKSAIKHFGFEVVDDFTGQSESGDNFSSNFITLRKTEDITFNVDEILSEMTKEEKDSFKFRREKKHLINTLDIIRKFNIGDNNFKIDFNEEDKKAYQEEQAIKLEAEKLKIKYGSISDIPPAEAENLGFWITFYNNRYVLMKKMEENRGIVYIKEKNKKF